MKRLTIAFAPLAAALLVSGCAWNRMRINDPSIVGRAALIRPGVTRAEEVPQILGAQPTVRIPGAKRLTLGYTYGDSKSNGLVLLLVNFSRTTTVTETLYVESDAETGLVTHVHKPPFRPIEWRFWPFGED